VQHIKKGVPNSRGRQSRPICGKTMH